MNYIPKFDNIDPKFQILSTLVNDLGIEQIDGGKSIFKDFFEQLTKVQKCFIDRIDDRNYALR